MKDFEDVNLICNIDKDQDWKMIYKASIDGFDEERFHKICDSLPETLTIAQTTYGYKFGGYREKEWIENEYAKDDEKSIAFYYNSIEKVFLKSPNVSSPKIGVDDDDVSITDSYHLIPSKPLILDAKNAASELKLIRVNQHINNSPASSKKKIMNTHNIFTLKEIEVYVKAKPEPLDNSN